MFDLDAEYIKTSIDIQKSLRQSAEASQDLGLAIEKTITNFDRNSLCKRINVSLAPPDPPELDFWKEADLGFPEL